MIGSSSTLEDLAEQISTASKAISGFLAEKDGPPLSFAQDGALEFPSGPEDIMIARRNLREATKKLYDLVTGPSEHLRWLACRYHDLSSLRWIYHFKIAEAIPLNSEVSFAEVASKAGVDESQVRRVLRHAMTNNLFCEPKVGYVAHTAESSILVRDKGLHSWVGYTTEESFPSSAKLVEATEKFGSSGEKTETAYNIAFDTTLPMFEYLSTQPERAERFAQTMGAMTATEGYNIRHLVNGFVWEQVEEGSTVVGGSTGHASVAIAEKAVGLNFIVQDLPEIVAQGESILNTSLKPRISFMAHDFFTPQPVQNADIYLLRFILHDYPDKFAEKILENIVPAMKENARLIVMDGILPEPNTLPKSEERIIRIMDMEMMTTFNAKERELEDWKALFTRVDQRLKLRNVKKPVGSVNSVMEVVLEA
ncbi:S-adenosyl-L-methionine-dependent methyltransferase [Glonium stellatum]|uniref:S-adenosyl-L-methionine-dependent methyltransferase n=1 Tax=Glonium stellatum TaxID=574774 RepID=A0A8E2ERC6_9PEZI|nr:S-adenosyl-L-methionine-dependent methyltransferase [Glonium stellatum]